MDNDMLFQIFAQARFKPRSDTLENWETKNPILLSGEPGVVINGTETEKIKFGDGVTPWNDLGWWKGPKGEKGDAGPTGPKGEKGDAGKNGTDGKDAITDQTYNPESENAQSGKAVAESLLNKQDTLVSGENIKTINGQSLLGEGNITIVGGSDDTDLSNYYTKNEVEEVVEEQVANIASHFGSILGKNLFNLDTVTPNKNFSSSGAVIDSEGGYCLTDYIKVEKNTTYAFQGRNSALITALRPMRHIFAYDENKVIISNSNKQNTSTYTTPENAVYVRFSFPAAYNSADSQPMFFIGEAFGEYEEYNPECVVDCKTYAEKVIGLTETINANKYNFSNVDLACDKYLCQTPKFEFENNTVDRLDVLYGMYDALVEAYPDYVTKTLLGTIAADNLPIYRYDFIPKLPINNDANNKNKLCKILYCSGTHGGEGSVLYGARFFTDLCENWRNQDLLKTLRFNCHFTVIPAVNPYGVKYKTRKNENEVDLNRNFTNGWNNSRNLDITSIEYPGENPASEISTQLIEGMIANEHFDFGLDHHTFSSYIDSTDKISGYFVGSTARPKDISFMNMMAVWMSSKTVSNNTLITDFSKSHFKTSSGFSPSGYLYGAFPNGLCFENITGWGDDEMEEAYECQKFNAETIGAIFYSAFLGYHTY